MWVYIRSEGSLFTVGFYDPAGKWQAESDHGDREEAAKRVAFLNGSRQGAADSQPDPTSYEERRRRLREAHLALDQTFLDERRDYLHRLREWRHLQAARYLKDRG